MVLVRRQATNPWIRHGLLAVFGLSIVALFATYSRGALIGLCLSLPLTLALTWRKDVPVLLATVAACLVIYAAPRQWVERMQTITPTVYRDDSSGSKRMKSWYVALRSGARSPVPRRRIPSLRAGRLRTVHAGLLGQPRRAQSLPAGLRRARLPGSACSSSACWCPSS